jgi:hypothetical protein
MSAEDLAALIRALSREEPAALTGTLRSAKAEAWTEQAGACPSGWPGVSPQQQADLDLVRKYFLDNPQAVQVDLKALLPGIKDSAAWSRAAALASRVDGLVASGSVIFLVVPGLRVKSVRDLPQFGSAK